MQLSIGSAFLGRRGFAEAVDDDEGLERSLEFLQCATRDGCEVCGLVELVKYIGSDLVDREVGYVMSEEGVRVQLGVFLKMDTISDMNTWMQ